jgi:hypothetical protein
MSIMQFVRQWSQVITYAQGNHSRYYI